MTKPCRQAGTLLGRTGSKLLFLCALTLLSVTSGQAQRFNSVVFSKLPQDYQLYPRDVNSEATVPVAGIVETAGWKYISVQVTRDGKAFQYRKADLQYGSDGKGKFAAEAKIKSELAEYGFNVYVCKDGDSVLVVKRSRVVSGDVYILSGQSNSTGFFGEADTNGFCRTFGKITGNLNTDPYNSADTLWTLSNMRSYDNGVGSMGFEIQKRLMEKSGIPNCLINAGFHWSSAYAHARRTENNPTDLTNGYGRMLYRAQKAGVANAVKAYIFRQGESEAYHEGGGWEENFDLLRKYLKMDMPGLQKFYVFQIDIIYYPSLVGALVRDYQRRLPSIYPDAVSLSTVGTTGFDGLHYSREGNQQSGFELSRLMLRDFYGSKDTSNIDSPSLKKAFYKDGERKQLILTFDEGQELIYPEPYKHRDGPTLDMKDFFYLDYSAGAVVSGKADGNRIVLELKATQNASTLYYLPLYVEQGGPYYPFMGPYITNKNGMRAFTFFNVPIVNGLANGQLTATTDDAGTVQLSWPAIANATQYILERKAGGETGYARIASLAEAARSFQDKATGLQGKVSYRLKGASADSESGDYAYAEVEISPILGVEKDPRATFTVFPNPAGAGQELSVTFVKPGRGTLSLFNTGGQKLTERQVNGQSKTTFKLPSNISGIHLMQFKSGNSTFTRKLWIK